MTRTQGTVIIAMLAIIVASGAAYGGKAWLDAQHRAECRSALNSIEVAQIMLDTIGEEGRKTSDSLRADGRKRIEQGACTGIWP